MRSVNFKITFFGAFLMLLSCGTVFANKSFVGFDSANAAYAHGDYEKAIGLYETIAAENGVSAELYYNLGNAYYKSNSIGKAILNYERALKLNADDEDILANLKLANQKTEDKIDAAPQLFLSEWKNGILDLFDEKTWSLLCIFLFALSLSLIAVYILARSPGWKKTGFYGGAVLLILWLLTFFAAGNKYESTSNGTVAIVLSGTATVNGSPNEKGTKLFILHEGTKVEITGENEDWTEIKIANGNVGWIPSKLIEKI